MTTPAQDLSAVRSDPSISDSARKDRQRGPPRARLALRIGVVGHRPDETKRPTPNVDALRKTVNHILRHIQDAFNAVARAHEETFDAAPGALRIISALAEGADQWVADEATRMEYELQAPLPFARSDYATDFKTPESVTEYERLLGLATTVLELDGTRIEPSRSYEAVGRIVLIQSDLLIAIWDGEQEKGQGGTGQMVREALERGIPTIWIKWSAPDEWQLFHEWRLLHKVEEAKGDWAHLTEQVFELLEPPKSERPLGAHASLDLRKEYFQEQAKIPSRLGMCWLLFRDLLTGKRRQNPGRNLRQGGSSSAPHTETDYVARAREDWEASWERKRNGEPLSHRLPAPVQAWVNEAFLEHYAWANRLSVHYADLYRSSFVLNFSLGALAVLFALLCVGLGLKNHAEIPFITVELLIILSILLLTWHGRKHRWHERWIDYRTLAERLRLARFLVPLGGGGQSAMVPGHLATYGNPAATWMHWHYRAVERSCGLPRGHNKAPQPDGIKFDHGYLKACQELLLESFIEDQKGYHHENITRLTKVDHRLHSFADGLFIATMIVCATHLALNFAGEEALPSWVGRWLTLFAAFFPALGAACAAIRTQGEFHRMVQRSQAMEDKLTQLQLSLASVPTRPAELNSVRLRDSLVQTAQLMANEVLDWRVVFQDRPLGLPS